MQVVDADDAGVAGERQSDLLGVDPGRRLLHQHVGRLAQDAPGAGEHQDADQDRHGGVGALPAGREHDQPRRDDPERAGQVGDDVPQRGTDVEALSRRAPEHPRGHEIGGEADRADDDDGSGSNGGWIVEPPRRLDEDPHGQPDEQGAVRERGKDFGPPVAEGARRRRRARGEPRRPEGEAERKSVREHVRRVGEERERIREEAAGDLDGGDPERKCQRDPERAPVAARARAVRVVVRVHRSGR